MANAFQHSFWTALMTKTGYDTTVLDRESLALDYATAHEAEQRRNPSASKRAGAQMDLHNNKVGHLFAKSSEARRKTRQRLCIAMRRATFGGQFGASGAGERQLYWIRILNDARNVVPAPERC